MSNPIESKPSIKVFSPWLGIISIMSLIAALVVKFYKGFTNIKNKDMYVSLGYIAAIISGLLFIDRNIKPIDEESENEEGEEDLEMIDNDLD